MASAVTAILKDIVSTLADAGLFATVSLGKSASDSAVPRAHVIYEGHDTFPSDDSSSNLWGRVRARVTIRTRSDDLAGGVTRAADLCTSAAEALMGDPFRGQLCRDLPIGPATEIGQSEIASDVRRPEMEITFRVRCHFEQEDS